MPHVDLKISLRKQKLNYSICKHTYGSIITSYSV